MVRILHTGDVHIGKVFEQFGIFGRQLRTQIRETFRNVLDLAASQRVDAVLLAGDIFDSDKIAIADIRFFMDAVNSMRPIPVFFLPGTWTHDSVYQKAIFRSRQFLDGRPENLQVFTKEIAETFRVASGELAIHGRAVLPDTDNPLDGIRPDPQASFNVGLLHTAVALPQIPEEPGSCALKREHLERCGLDYLALGDWHSFRRYFEDAKTVVQYSGSPETLQFKGGEDSGFVALVTLGSGPPQVEKRQVGHYKWKELNLSWQDAGSVDALKRQLAGLANPQTILKVTIAGSVSDKQLIDWDRLREEISPQFAYLDFDTSQVKEELPLEELEHGYRESTIQRAFVTLLRGALENTQKDEEKQQLREVLRRGHALFQGYEEVLL
jgi:DNA repair exonuclease SbcCD nuclease subunit